FLLLAVCASLALVPALHAQTGSTEPRTVVYDGAQIGEGAKGWSSAPKGKAQIVAQDKVVRTAGKKALAFKADGKEYLGCGWNWFGWFPDDAGTDISDFKSLQFWAKLEGESKPPVLNVTLVANDKEKKSGDACSLVKYAPDLADGKWHHVTIPIADLDAKRG